MMTVKYANICVNSIITISDGYYNLSVTDTNVSGPDLNVFIDFRNRDIFHGNPKTMRMIVFVALVFTTTDLSIVDHGNKIAHDTYNFNKDFAMYAVKYLKETPDYD